MRKTKTSSQISENIQDSPNELQIKKQLQKILTSSEFHATEPQARFFTYVVLESLYGRSTAINGYAIARKVLGRASDFDSGTDPIVSMHANKLRRALERYYLIEGIDDPIKIDIPKGAYVPSFIEQSQNRDVATPKKQMSEATVSLIWPVVAIQPFRNLTSEPNIDIFGSALLMELTVEIARAEEIKAVLMDSSSKNNDIASANFVLGGSIYSDTNGIRVTVHLEDPKTGIQIFGHTFQSTLSDVKDFTFAKEIAGAIAATLTSENGVISKIFIQKLPEKLTAKMTPYEAILRYYAFTQDSTEDNATKALEALNLITKSNPSFSLTWSFLARLYAELHSFGVPGFENIMDKAKACAENAVRLNPNSQRTLLVLAFVYFHCNNLDSSKKYLNRALDNFPDSHLHLDLFGYLLVLLGDWDRGILLIRKAMRVNPNYSPIVHYAIWLNFVRLGNYEQAYIETSGIIRSSIFWCPLAIASTLGLMGKHQEGVKFYKEVLQSNPDFFINREKIIKHYVKFKKVSDRIIKGLDMVDMIA